MVQGRWRAQHHSPEDGCIVAKNKQAPQGAADDLELFASFVKAEETKERENKRQAQEQRRLANVHQALIDAKDKAAAEVKRIRAKEHSKPEERAAADEAYRDALGALMAHESGESLEPQETDTGIEAEESGTEESDTEVGESETADPEPSDTAVEQ